MDADALKEMRHDLAMCFCTRARVQNMQFLAISKLGETRSTNSSTQITRPKIKPTGTRGLFGDAFR